MVRAVQNQAVSHQAIKSVRPNTRQQAIAIAQHMSQDCVARRLRQVNRTVTRLYDEALRPYGLTVNQLNILAVIISKNRIRPGQLAQALGMEKSTVSRTINRMMSKGWLKVTSGTDSRTQLLSTTPKGNQLLLAVTPVWDTLQADMLTTDGHNILNMLMVGEAFTSTQPPHASPTADESCPKDAPVSADDFYL